MFKIIGRNFAPPYPDHPSETNLPRSLSTGALDAISDTPFRRSSFSGPFSSPPEEKSEIFNQETLMRKDLHLIDFFHHLQNQVPQSMLDSLQFEKGVHEKAGQIRNFLQTNPIDDESGLPILDTISTLDLSYSSLTELPPEISLLRNLTHLDISHTQIAFFPENFNPPRLEKLFAEYTCLTGLPKAFFPGNLKVLHLVGSPIASLPSSFNLEELQWLDLTETSIDLLPGDFNPPKLTSLFLSDSPICRLPSCLELTRLDDLHLDGTAIPMRV